MAEARGLPEPATLAQFKLLTSGPGRLSEAFSITRARDNGRNLTDPASGLWVGEDSFHPVKVIKTPRIGITKHAELKLRYVIAGNAFVSGPRKMLVSTARK